MKDNFIITMQKMTATSAIGPSALRNQGEGILKKAQDHCSKIDLSIYSSFTKSDFLAQLDKETNLMLHSFGNESWGTARKALNLFFRSSLYNKYLSDEYKLQEIEKYLEIPLDSAVTTGLKKRGKRGQLPKWPGLKNLRKDVSDIYQNFAQKEADNDKFSRIHLDMYLWLENR